MRGLKSASAKEFTGARGGPRLNRRGYENGGRRGGVDRAASGAATRVGEESGEVALWGGATR